MRARRHQSAVVVAAIVSMAAIAVPARASLYCEIASSRDGYAALRAAPDRKAKLLMKLAPDSIVQMDSTKEAPARAKDWLAVSAVEGPQNRVIGRGWLHKSLIKPDSCG